MKVMKVSDNIPKCSCSDWKITVGGSDIGDTFNVIQTVPCACGCYWYVFAEKEKDRAYYSGNYAPISNIDGDQLYEEEKENLKINLEVLT